MEHHVLERPLIPLNRRKPSTVKRVLEEGTVLDRDEDAGEGSVTIPISPEPSLPLEGINRIERSASGIARAAGFQDNIFKNLALEAQAKKRNREVELKCEPAITIPVEPLPRKQPSVTGLTMEDRKKSMELTRAKSPLRPSTQCRSNSPLFGRNVSKSPMLPVAKSEVLPAVDRQVLTKKPSVTVDLKHSDVAKPVALVSEKINTERTSNTLPKVVSPKNQSPSPTTKTQAPDSPSKPIQSSSGNGPVRTAPAKFTFDVVPSTEAPKQSGTALKSAVSPSTKQTNASTTPRRVVTFQDDHSKGAIVSPSLESSVTVIPKLKASTASPLNATPVPRKQTSPPTTPTRVTTSNGETTPTRAAILSRLSTSPRSSIVPSAGLLAKPVPTSPSAAASQAAPPATRPTLVEKQDLASPRSVRDLVASFESGKRTETVISPSRKNVPSLPKVTTNLLQPGAKNGPETSKPTVRTQTSTNSQAVPSTNTSWLLIPFEWSRRAAIFWIAVIYVGWCCGVVTLRFGGGGSKASKYRF